MKEKWTEIYLEMINLPLLAMFVADRF
ncbi:hypothetical protein PPL_07897 [Heterostelium album PN500]|uniref:Uncharacterized protein n=1 Tax=Heterostelium pallidum (strain ATCC 26659 / Pp 5 / PN500) TaxID=670386 RepID=D3BH95_HETP5|nr:hypothetical protein PPL_07897 [Heterostelium album PN500]